MNKLYYGDNLTIMRGIESASVDLIYLDPPFNSNRSYNAIYKDETGRPLPDQIEAFCDLWTLNEESERTIRQMPVLMRGNGIADDTIKFWQLWMKALRASHPKMLAYLAYMVERLIVMKGLLRLTGSIYLHCDPTASHYIKVMMDGIFGHNNFRNEIIWKRTNAHPLSIKKFEAISDAIFFYTKSNQFVFNGDTTPMTEEQMDELFRHEDERGRFADTDLTGGKAGSQEAYQPFKSKSPSKGRAWAPPAFEKLPQWAREKLGSVYASLNQLEKCYALDDADLIYWTRSGNPRFKRYMENEPTQRVSSIWTDITPASGNEDMGYDTQKPVKLLERIIRASSNEGDVVLDPFCGCATTLEAAHKLNRQWIGIDIAIHAIKRVAAVRLGERCHLEQGKDFEVSGVPLTLEGAKDLWERDKYHFQKWAVEEVDGFVTTKRTADGGIDGRLYFDMPGERDLQNMILEVKGGKNVSITDLRAVHSVMEQEEALMAGLILMEPLGKRQMTNFLKFAAKAGDLELSGTARSYPRIQILFVSEILQGKRFNTPTPMGKKETLQQSMPL